MKEWDTERNAGIDPKKCYRSSGKKVSWVCPCGHQWKSVIAKRTVRNQGCPKCKTYTQTSFPEQSLFYFMSNRFDEVSNRKKIGSMELDIFIPSLNLGIEYDGVRWHEKKEEKDREKNEKCQELGIDLIRIREHGLPNISGSTNFWIKRNVTLEVVADVCKEVWGWMTETYSLPQGTNIDFHWNLSAINEYISKTKKEDSFKVRYPEVVKEWDTEKNHGMDPGHFSYASGREVWWKCAKGHRWVQRISKRTVGKEKCPYCANRRIGEDNSLRVLAPALAKEWHPEKNGATTPDTVGVQSSKKVWWKCSAEHVWEATVVSRYKGNGCPCCSGLKACSDSNLERSYPELAKEWGRKNEAPPSHYRPSSGKKVWWQCAKGHEWQAKISHRATLTNNCPYCYGRYATKENNLQVVHPEIAAQWHPEYNDSLSPADVLPHSGKKVWWQCAKGHEWKTSVGNRAKGTKCPYCSNHKVCQDNCLRTLNPALAAEWHPEKNGALTPEQVTPGSNKSVWWQCAKGHEWQTKIAHRKKGSGCKVCRKKTPPKEKRINRLVPREIMVEERHYHGFFYGERTGFSWRMLSFPTP